MKMVYFKGKEPNFGDDLNPWMWPKFFSGMFDEDDSEYFIGIGSIIGMGGLVRSSRKIVFGAAFVPEYKQKPDIGENYDFRFVRGPRTAELLGLDPSLAICDSAALLNVLLKDAPRSPDVVSFMPHWESAGKGNWQKACELAGIHYIDPRGDVDFILGEMLKSKVILAEAMHGAIVADALRVPWIPLLPLHPINRAKWNDWSAALDLALPRHSLRPSAIAELRLSRMQGAVERSPLARPLTNVLVHRAARRLSSVAQEEPMLSRDADMSLVVERMMGKVEELRRERGI